MKYEIGDRIILLHSEEEGKIIDILNDKMVMVEVDSVQFPVYMDQIDFPYYNLFTQKKVVSKQLPHVDQLPKDKKVTRQKMADGVFVSIIPVYNKDVFEEDIVEKLKIYLINYNQEPYQFKYQLIQNNQCIFELRNTILGLSDFYLNDILFDELSHAPNFVFEFSLVHPNKKKAPYFERNVKLRGKQIFKKIEEIKTLNQPSFLMELFLQYPDVIQEESLDLSHLKNAGFVVYPLQEAKKYLPPAKSVVDLHAEQIVIDPTDFTSAELLNFQIHEFEKYLELALIHHLPTIIFIHGIGEGKLKTELHQRLKKHSRVKSFENRFHPLYGFGATEVHLIQ